MATTKSVVPRLTARGYGKDVRILALKIARANLSDCEPPNTGIGKSDFQAILKRAAQRPMKIGPLWVTKPQRG